MVISMTKRKYTWPQVGVLCCLDGDKNLVSGAFEIVKIYKDGSFRLEPDNYRYWPYGEDEDGVAKPQSNTDGSFIAKCTEQQIHRLQLSNKIKASFEYLERLQTEIDTLLSVSEWPEDWTTDLLEKSLEQIDEFKQVFE